MCGRFALIAAQKDLEKRFACKAPAAFLPNHNIGPGQSVMVLSSHEGARGLHPVHWGMRIPQRSHLLINARAETIAEKPAFQKSFRESRALIPADAFYEWKARQPYCVRALSHEPFAMAALIRDDSCVIITTEASPSLRAIHHRMPVILESQDWAPWLGEEKTAASLQTCLKPLDDRLLEFFPVSSRVNNIRHNDADCLTPLPPEAVADQPSLL